jgi:GT2 family glycosyltransferase
VESARNGLQVETIVVDNDSVDGSVEHIRHHFPEVRLIANADNRGFARANNQAIREARGKYVLLLNPDTILEKDTLTQCFGFMEKKPGCGAVGVKMIDGEGKFLPESKRGFPTPFTSLMRLTGLSRLFPESRIFNQYNLGYLDEDEINEVDVLCGAFMFIRKEALDRVGLLDEAFFMYGEDIDLSYRIQQGGYRIFYLPTTTIVHFKGESTKKSSLRYYSTFYSAMAIFAKKHYGGRRINPFLWLINLAIFFVGLSDYLVKTLSRLLLPFIEFVVFLQMLHVLEYVWARYYYGDPGYYSAFNSFPVYLLYSLLWVASLWMAGSYRRIRNIKRLIWGVVGGSLTMLILYALMDNSMRHSRAIILLSSLASLSVSMVIRFLYGRLLRLKIRQGGKEESRVIVVGDPGAIEQAREILLSNRNQHKRLIGALDPEPGMEPGEGYMQSLSRLEQVVEVFRIDEVLFAPDAVPMKEIMRWMTILGTRVRIKILSKDVQSIIGSHDRNSRGDLYTVELTYNIQLPVNRISKVLIDYLFGLVLLAIGPFVFMVTGRYHLFNSIFRVFYRKRTWIGYISDDAALPALPVILPGIAAPVVNDTIQSLSEEEKHSINFFYARDYSIQRELGIILLNLRFILSGKN